MDENKQALEKLTGAIHERIASLDAPVRELLLSDEYVINLKEIITAHSLNPKDAAITEEVTTNFLLGTIRPSELEQDFAKELVGLTKDNVRSLYNDIKSKILNPIWSIVESAWQEDDENEEIWKEVVEMSEVPLPPNLQTINITTVGDKLKENLIQQDLINKLQKEEPKEIQNEFKIEDKLNTLTAVPEIQTENRTENNRTLPKIGLGQNDIYRENPE